MFQPTVSSLVACQFQRFSFHFLEAIDCGLLGAPLNGSSSGDFTVFPNTKHFTCDPGFILNGSSVRVCEANGIWSGTNTTCTGWKIYKGRFFLASLCWVRGGGVNVICLDQMFFNILFRKEFGVLNVYSIH